MESSSSSPEVDSNKFKDLISTLPRSNGYSPKDDLYNFQGFWYIEPFLKGLISAQEHFKPKPDHVIVASCPKTGSTWLKALTFAISTRSTFDDSTSPLLNKLPHVCVPFLEFDDLSGDQSICSDMKIPLVSTHVPFTSLPKTILDCGCKIIYVWRHPNDVFVSLWHFLAKYLRPRNLELISIEDAFELFCQGITYYGPYWDHVLGYWKASLEFPDRILFLKYEEMMKDTSFYTKKIAEFMGYPFSAEQEENGVVERIVKMCSFDNLSNLEVNKNGKHREQTEIAAENHIYFRKAKVGDWKNHLTPEMGARLAKIFELKLQGSAFPYELSD